MPRRSHVGMLLDPRKISVDAPQEPPITITDVKVVLLATTFPMTDQALINICADDAGGTIPGTVLRGFPVTVPGAGPSSFLLDLGEPDPSLIVTSGEAFWLWFGRTGIYPHGGQYYRCMYGPNNVPVGKGRAGINPAHGFQWYDGADWYSFTAQTLAVVVDFSNGASINNLTSGYSTGITFGLGDQTSYYAASKFIVP